MWLPGLIQLLLLLLGLAGLYHHVPPAAAAAQQRRSQEPDGADAALVTAQLSETDELHEEDRHSA